jgi:hypothetical protein
MIDFAQGKGAEATSQHLNVLIGAAMEAERQQQGRRDYLGGSRLGEECLRRLGYEYHGVEEDPGAGFSPETLRIFQRGHDCEARMAKYLIAAGFDLRTEKEDGGQFGFYAANDSETGRARIRGHADGVIVGWWAPAGLRFTAGHLGAVAWAEGLRMDMRFPMLWENKGLNDKGFRAVSSQGLKKAKPLYYAQIQLYMAYFDIPRALFTIENQNTCEIWADIMPLDREAAQTASDRGVAVISARAPEDLPRFGKAKDEWPCGFCPYKERCWAGAAAQVSVALPVWMDMR